MTDHITIKHDGHIMMVGLNRPEKMNALTADMLRKLSKAFTDFEHDKQYRVMVIHAAGDNFCSGLQLDEVAEPLMDQSAEPLVPAGCLDPWGIKTARVSKPIIMAVQGYCLTAAMELCFAAEIVIAAKGTQFAQIEVAKGLYPVGGATTRWQLAAGYQNAMRYLLTGDFFDVEEARRIGIVQDIVEPDELLDYALKMAHRVAANAPKGIRATIKTARAVQDSGHQAGADLIFPLIYDIYRSKDAKRGIDSFVDRSTPVFEDD